MYISTESGDRLIAEDGYYFLTEDHVPEVGPETPSVMGCITTESGESLLTENGFCLVTEDYGVRVRGWVRVVRDAQVWTEV